MALQSGFVDPSESEFVVWVANAVFEEFAPIVLVAIYLERIIP